MNRCIHVFRSISILTLGRRPPIRFLIVCRSRVGSTYLASLLSSHPNVLGSGEVLSGRSRIERTFISWIGVTGYFDRIVFRCMSPKTKAIGFKLMYYHARRPLDKNTPSIWPAYGPERLEKIEPIWSYLTGDLNIRIIHLTRENVLRTHLSLLNARKTGRWTSRNKIPLPNVHKQPLRVDEKMCEQVFTATQAYQEECRTLFQKHPFLEISYEQLTRGHLYKL